MDEAQAQKLEKFNESVDAEVGKHISKIMKDADKASRESLKKAEDDALFEAYNKIQKAVRETEAKYRKMYALEEQKFRMDSLRYRDELSKKIFSNVKEKLTEFVSSEKYSEYLMSVVDSEKPSDSAVVAVSPRDKEYGEKLKAKYGCEVTTDDSIELGGIMFIDSEQGLIIDRTFDSALEDQRKAFSSRYSFKAGS